MESLDSEQALSSTSMAQTSYLDGNMAGIEQTGASVQFSPPFQVSEQSPMNNQPDAILSPTQSNLHPLPTKPVSNPFSQPYMEPTPAQSKPRIVGGFEVDDEDDEGSQDGKDEVDVYDPSVGMDFDASTPADAFANEAPNLLDRTSQSPEQENGNTPLPVQATGSPADADVSSFTPAPGVSTGLHAPHAATATPPYTAPDLPAQTSPPRPHVNGSVVPGFPKSRLAHDVVGILEDRIKDDPRGDLDAYLELIDEFKNRTKQEDVRRVYEEFLKIFPFAVRADNSLPWASY